MSRMGRQPSRWDVAKPAAQRLAGAFSDRFQERRAIEPWRGWYNLARWAGKPNGLRWRALVRDLFTCQICGKVESDTSQLVADHKQPHRGDPALFWAETNVWCLCATCHNRVKQAEERADG